MKTTPKLPSNLPDLIELAVRDAMDLDALAWFNRNVGAAIDGDLWSVDDRLRLGIPRESVDAAKRLIVLAFNTKINRAPWPVYLEAARILREGARVEALESREAK